MDRKKAKRPELFLEFLIFGVVVVLVEDLIAVKVSTGEPITWYIGGIVFWSLSPLHLSGKYWWTASILWL